MNYIFFPFKAIGYLAYYTCIMLYYLLYSLYYTWRIRWLEKRRGEEAAAVYARSKGVEISRRSYLWFGMKPEIDGFENLPKDRGYMIASNHLSAVGASFVYSYIAPEAFVLVKKEIASYPIVGVLAKRMAVFIDRDDPRQAVYALRAALDLLRKGHILALFPEGTRSLDGRIGPFAKGSLRIAMMTKSLIVPLVITGNENIMPKGTVFIKRAKVKARILPPVDASLYKSEEELVDVVRGGMIEALKELVE